MTTEQKAENLAWNYLRMAKKHVAGPYSAAKLIAFDAWNPDMEFTVTKKIREMAKQHAFYFQALEVLK